MINKQKNDEHKRGCLYLSNSHEAFVEWTLVPNLITIDLQRPNFTGVVNLEPPSFHWCNRLSMSLSGTHSTTQNQYHLCIVASHTLHWEQTHQVLLAAGAMLRLKSLGVPLLYIVSLLWELDLTHLIFFYQEEYHLDNFALLLLK